MITPRVFQIAAVLIVLLWGAALLFPSLGTCRGGEVTWFDNSTVVLFGWLGPFMGMFGWFANSFLVFSLVAMGCGLRPPLLVTVIEIALAVTTFRPAHLAHDEAHFEPLCAWGAGFWMWFSTHLAVLALALAGWAIERSHRRAEAPPLG